MRSRKSPALISMPSLKLVSIHANPYRFIRTIATSARPKSSTTSLGLNVRIAGKRRTAEKMPPCAPLVFRNSKLGFRGCNSLSSSHVADSHSSDDKSGDFGQNGGLNKQEDRLDDERQPSKFLTLPTVLTIARVAAVPLLVNTFYMDSRWGTTATTSIFVLASITDWLDGYLARKMKLSSQFGAFLDPVADKLMVATTLILLCTNPLAFDTFGQVPWLLTVPAIAIIGREITMSAVREWAASQDSKLLEAVAVNNLGKWKTATQMTALTILLTARDSSLVGYGGLVATGVALLYVSAWLAVWSLFVYMRKISKVLFK